MKKFYSLLAAIAVSATVSAQAFTATYAFAGTPPVTTAVTTGSNYTASAFTSVGYTQTATGNRFTHEGAPTAGVLDTSKYLQVTVTPAAGYYLDVSSITFRAQRSGTGPRYYAVRSSVDGYAANLPASIVPANAELEVVPTNQFHYVNDISTGQNGSTVTPAITNQAGAVTFRFYFYGAEATTGTFSVDDVVITGNVDDSNLSVSDVNGSKVKLVKNTIVNNAIVFGAKANVNIVNANGQVVKSAAVTEGTSLDVSSLNKGMYIITGDVNGQTVSQKIIKQ
ncbi:hypothetical protein CO230_07880 [Chryseobacterium sp. 6424]|uniref:T9SS type A sorting domain-containing protein n=1 Tax=Chryseobacterium sp. 6424 TaxID=2039166 RepID=UPI000EFD74AD|nr:T9SS type A sorting domain-containing protein [Chryseobacterium sp. 6424]AYO58048.1 hypothetical protein CO230_07880 [Chryseobacterium sp. 6424]